MRLFASALAAGLIALASPAAAQSFPSRAITMIVPFAAGGTTDIIARIVSEHMSRTLGQSIVVENVGGAGGTTGSTRVARATPDGYTLIMGNMGTHSASVGLYPNLAYDPRTDFEPIMNAAGTPMMIAAHKDFPASTLQEMIALIRANPGRYNYGHGGVGSTSHLTCVFFHHLVGAPVQHVPFRGSGPALAALLGKQLDYVCDQTVTIVPQLANLKTYVVATPSRLGVAPDVPTSAEAGLPVFQVVGWNAMFAPKGTPREIIERLNAAGRAALADESVRKRLLELGCEIPDAAGQTPEALGAHVRAEVEKWTPVIKAAGVTAGN
ncbi:tripartite tricarboxylate transporter substrate binding protein BugD [Phreatobacter aquaticus]|uniref:Tripartite tricarboxylate transporter substrate binding protein BugD n=1 Tax=Phreatobacter aquaticus TaxID=2570229 RepID=A0A4D7QKC2_9HYPH|nr:tripartite tricarboxylate transporter substrate-binding protein [Phreatobacter aquaticus]QCK85766.1 tripartite tricarboxylate transporter substrate binding protein BugD [Phreatobacter aquaticus]